MRQDHYTIQVDPEAPATWDPFGIAWPIVAVPFVAAAAIATLLLWTKRRKPRPRG